MAKKNEIIVKDVVIKTTGSVNKTEKISVADFADAHLSGTYIIWCSENGVTDKGNHLVTIIDGKIYDTWVCVSEDYKTRGETKTALDAYYQLNCVDNKSHYDFCVSRGWQQYIDTMLAVDYIKPDGELVDEIISDIKSIKNKEHLEIIYKFVKSLKLV